MGKRTSRQKGFYYERSLARKLWAKGFAVVRGPGSGGGAKEIVQPDLVAIRNGRIFVFEIKVRWKRTVIYLDRVKVERLKEFAKRAGGMAFIAVKIVDRTDWKFIPVETLEETRGGNFRVDLDSSPNVLSLENIVGMSDSVKNITEYMVRD
ncbi:MAG: Holliday junction resolvase [Desulfurococcales archaeon]|nr:Holliday junction resolvase [Desulfurococcales archaeon]MEB3759036.1 Holliday junction resolvase [Desulfurococcales archaeon]MEB3772372.1 Holliday junction resolvase [Desulfurococcales archaeon]MEB3786960.1 Holliday junction resolvase [Desulfurococcales archaeon]MEB3799437.1 Holliday junction resolvase [Desulfurococcales archaeon]